MRRWSLTLIAWASLTTCALAHEHPIASTYLSLRDPDGAVERRRFRFRVRRDVQIDPSLADDPRVVGASLEVTGRAPRDGATGLLSLDPSLWVGLGEPPGSRGYRYSNRGSTLGVRRILFRASDRGGTLAIDGGGERWSHTIVQPQGAIDVRFTVGEHVYCARITDFLENGPGRVTARDAPPPPACSICGNGVTEGSEECDDGNQADGDGCSSSCTLQDVSALCAGVPTVGGTALDAVRITSGLEFPVHLTAPRLDPNRLFVVEQAGRIRVVENGVLRPAPFLAIEDKVWHTPLLHGLYSVAFDPDYETNGFFYVNYSCDSNGNPSCPANRATLIARYQVTADPNTADPASEHVLLAVEQPFGTHNGGQNAFGVPPDRYLYVGMGDSGVPDCDPLGYAQDDASLLGKLLRIDVDTETVETWAKGLRNPWRFSFDRLTGDLYLADVGHRAWEEVNFQPGPTLSGLNYGWNFYEGRHCSSDPPSSCPVECPLADGFTAPVLEYGHNGFYCAVTGGFAYRGCRMPDLHGTYFYSDVCGGFIRSFKGVSGGDAQNLMDHTSDLAPGGGQAINSVTSFGEDARGELYIVDPGSGEATDGEIYRIVPGS